MQQQQKWPLISLALLFAFRLLGLFLILPIFSLYATHLPDSNPKLIGIALGIYGLTQACLQIPFGLLSDRFGRKPMIVIGLIIFAGGSIIAALASSIEMIIIGRAIQGAGAIGSVIIALVADLTSDENRSKAMAFIGMAIGCAFMLAMILGPLLNSWIGVSGIFWLTAGLAVFGIILLLITVPTPPTHLLQRDAEPVPQLLLAILRNKELLRLDIGIFCLHAILTAIFIVIPITLAHQLGIAEPQQWWLYFPILLVAFIIGLFGIMHAEKQRRLKFYFCGAIGLLALSQLLLLMSHQLSGVIVALLLFFIAFVFLEATLPSLIARTVPAGGKGTAMGIYSTSQFLGIFIGGSVGGWLFAEHAMNSVFIATLTLVVMWLALSLGMKKPKYLTTFSINLAKISPSHMTAMQQRLSVMPGVDDVFIDSQQQLAYLKIDKQQADMLALHALIDNMREKKSGDNELWHVE